MYSCRQCHKTFWLPVDEEGVPLRRPFCPYCDDDEIKGMQMMRDSEIEQDADYPVVYPFECKTCGIQFLLYIQLAKYCPLCGSVNIK